MAGGEEDVVLEAKCMVVGSPQIGKTSLLMSLDNEFKLAEEHFSNESVPGVHDIVMSEVAAEDKKVRLSVWDTAGSADYARLRPLSYPETNVFLVCFSIASQQTLDDIRNIWVPEIRQSTAHKPIVLVGMKADLREVGTPGLVSTSDGHDMAKAVGAQEYFEVSAKTGQNMEDLFACVAKVAVDPKLQNEPSNCSIS